MEVVVFTAEHEELVGAGELHREDLHVVDDKDKIIFTLKDHPHIIMEDGEIILGLECWWIPMGEFVTANQQVLRAFGGSL